MPYLIFSEFHEVCVHILVSIIHLSYKFNFEIDKNNNFIRLFHTFDKQMYYLYR